MAPRSLANQSRRGNVEASPRHLLAGRGSSTPRFASVTLVARRNVAPDSTFRFGNPGRRSETWRRLVAPRRGGAQVSTSYLDPKAKTARNVAPAWRRGPPAFWLRGSPDFGFFERKKHSFQFDSGNPTAWRPKSPGNRSRCETWRPTPRFAEASVTEAKRGAGRHVSPRDQGY